MIFTVSSYMIERIGSISVYITFIFHFNIADTDLEPVKIPFFQDARKQVWIILMNCQEFYLNLEIV